MPSTDKARIKSKDIGGSDHLTGGCVCQRVKAQQYQPFGTHYVEHKPAVRRHQSYVCDSDPFQVQEDGPPVPKHVGADIYNELYFMVCILLYCGHLSVDVLTARKCPV
jgi:hypothetical protein